MLLDNCSWDLEGSLGSDGEEGGGRSGWDSLRVESNIRTPRFSAEVQSSTGRDDSQGKVVGFGNWRGDRKGPRKGWRISRWFNSYLTSKSMNKVNCTVLSGSEDLLVSLYSKFDDAKEEVNLELAVFLWDVEEATKKGLLSEAARTAEDLIVLSQQCIEMDSSQFRENCERIVQVLQDLSERRQQSQSVVMGKLIKYELFIFTCCTRLLQFHKGREQMNEDSLERIRQRLESVPSIEIKWVPKPANVEQFCLSKHSSEGHNETLTCSIESFIKEDARNSISPGTKKTFTSTHDCVLQCHDNELSLLNNLMIQPCQESVHEEEEHTEGLNLVMCRICEEKEPTSCLECHSYICAYADKCDSECQNMDDQLHKISDILELIVDSYNKIANASCSSPEISTAENTTLVAESKEQSPKVQEWHSKGTEGMFEDLHEMDTACRDDLHVHLSIV